MRLHEKHGAAWEKSPVFASLSAKRRPAMGSDRTTDNASKVEVLKSPPIGHFVRFSLRAKKPMKFVTGFQITFLLKDGSIVMQRSILFMILTFSARGTPMGRTTGGTIDRNRDLKGPGCGT